MDTLAALALATEKPHPSIIKTPPLKQGDNILTPVVWRQIYGVSLYIIFVMVILMVFGPLMWDLQYKQIESVIQNSDKLTHYTILFNTFIFMTLFNEINCRKVGSRQFNVFSNIFSNIFFILVIAAILAAQFTLVEFFGFAVRLAKLDGRQMAACIIWGASVLVISAFLKLTPDNWIKKLPITIDENKKINENDPLMKLYNKQANAKATGGKKTEVPTVQPE